MLGTILSFLHVLIRAWALKSDLNLILSSFHQVLTLENLCNLFKPWFPHLEYRNSDSTYVIGWLYGLR